MTGRTTCLGDSWSSDTGMIVSGHMKGEEQQFIREVHRANLKFGELVCMWALCRIAPAL